MSVHRTAKIELRCTPDEKARLQAEADAVGVSVSALVRNRMRDAVTASSVKADLPLDTDELQSLRSWLNLADSDGHVDSGLLASWSAFADSHEITFAELLKRVVVDANEALVLE